MTIQTAKNGQLTTTTEQPKPPVTLEQLVVGMHKQMESVLPSHLKADRMARIAVTALRTTKDLASCTASSFIASIMACSTLGLEPNTPLGQAYLIPYYNKRQQCLDCQLIIGYQGYIDLIRRSGQAASIQAFPVYAGDFFEYELGLEPTLKHKPSDDVTRGDDPTKLTHVYCVVKLKDKAADPIFLVMTSAQVERRKKRSVTAGTSYSPWATDYEAMALKTVVRGIVKWAPRSTEMATAVEIEDRTDMGAAIAPALPADVQQHLLTSGNMTSDEPEEDQRHEPSAEDDGRA
jgi:recombination protein RecT